MQENLHNEEWLHSCDLCGSMNYVVLQNSPDGLHRCGDCGLVQRPQNNIPEQLFSAVDEPLFTIALRQIIRRMEEPASESSILIIGPPPASTLNAIRDSHLNVTILVNYGEDAGLSGIPVQFGSLENAPFRPEQFDVILCARRTDTLNSTATLFTRSRLWLRQGGLLFASGTNWGSIERRTFPGRWHARHRGGRTFPDAGLVKDYAARHCFTLLSSGTRSRIEEIAGIAFGSPAPSFLSLAAVMPLWLLSALPGLGCTWWGILVKRQYTSRPVLRRLEEETERTPGLIAAGYSSAPREITEVEG